MPTFSGDPHVITSKACALGLQIWGVLFLKISKISVRALHVYYALCTKEHILIGRIRKN